MAEIKIKLSQVINLGIELDGHTDNNGNVLYKGILGQELSLVAKYWLTKLSKTVGEEKAKIDSVRNELIKKYATQGESGNLEIPVFADAEKKEINPAYKNFTDEFSTLLSEEVEIKYEPIKLSLLNKIETTENYTLLYDFVDPEK